MCEEHGIKRHVTIRKTSQHNGVVERMNRYVAKSAQCIILNTRLKKKLWAEVVSMGCNLINRSLRAALDEKVAKGVWTYNEVDYSGLRVFGCPTYAHIFGEERSKLDAKSRQCIFLGYQTWLKASSYGIRRQTRW